VGRGKGSGDAPSANSRRKVEALAGGGRGAQVGIGRIPTAGGGAGGGVLVQPSGPVKQRQLMSDQRRIDFE